MSKQSRALQELMAAVDAGQVVDSASSDKLFAPRRSTHGRGRQQGARAAVIKKPAAAAASPDDSSFEFSAFVSNSSASPASMVFSDGQLRAHQYPAVRSSATSSQAASPLLTSSSSSMGSTKAAGTMGSKKRVSFAMDGGNKAAASKAGGGQEKKSGGLLGCMGCACGSSRKDVVEPAKNVNRKVVAV